MTGYWDDGGSLDHHPDCPGGCGELLDECRCAQPNPLGTIRIEAGIGPYLGFHRRFGWEANTLNVRPGRDVGDERHIAALQLDFIDRCVRLWSNPGEKVLTPFAGIGSEVYVAVKRGRYGIGCELKKSYWETAARNLRDLEAEMAVPMLFADAAS